MLQTSHFTFQQANTLVNTYSCVTIKRVSEEVTFLHSKVTAYLGGTRSLLELQKLTELMRKLLDYETRMFIIRVHN